MKRLAVTIVAVVVLAAGSLAGAKPADFAGTWVGATMVPDVGEDRLKLELKAEGNTYTGTMSDSAGMVVPGSVTNVIVAETALTFDITVVNASGNFPVHVTLKIDGDTMTGAWATQEGESAPVVLTRQK